jgi:hypothetical protein
MSPRRKNPPIVLVEVKDRSADPRVAYVDIRPYGEITFATMNGYYVCGYGNGTFCRLLSKLKLEERTELLEDLRWQMNECFRIMYRRVDDLNSDVVAIRQASALSEPLKGWTCPKVLTTLRSAHAETRTRRE